MPDPATLRDLPLFQGLGSNQPNMLLAKITAAPLPGISGSSASVMGERSLVMAESGYDPAATLPQRVVKRILALEFVEMAELLPDAWTDENTVPDSGQLHRRARHPPVTDILIWLECFSRLAAMLCTKFPSKAPEFWAYQTSILRAAKNFEGTVWVTYDRQYRREALARHEA